MPLAALSPFWLRFAGVAAFVAAVFAGGYKVASSHYGGIIAETRAQHLEAVAEANRKTRLIDEVNRRAANAASEAYAWKNREREVVTKVITKEVIKYVETDNARECGLSASGVRLHDTAARGRVPEDARATAGTDDGAIAATNAEVIMTVTDNYNTCNETRDKLIGLQNWVRAVTRYESQIAKAAEK